MQATFNPQLTEEPREIIEIEDGYGNVVRRSVPKLSDKPKAGYIYVNIPTEYLGNKCIWRLEKKQGIRETKGMSGYVYSNPYLEYHLNLETDDYEYSYVIDDTSDASILKGAKELFRMVDATLKDKILEVFDTVYIVPPAKEPVKREPSKGYA